MYEEVEIDEEVEMDEEVEIDDVCYYKVLTCKFTIILNRIKVISLMTQSTV